MTINVFGAQQDESSLNIAATDDENSMIHTRTSRNVQAYAKLEFDAFSFYVQTLQVIIGRKASKTDQVDVHIGSTKAISRQHAKLFYDFTSQHFKIFVMGKNGAFVNEQFVECGQTIPLYDKTKIQIGKVFFTFLLPKSTENDQDKKSDIDQKNIQKSEFLEGNAQFLNDVPDKQFCTTYLDMNLEPNSLKTHESTIVNNEASKILDMNTEFSEDSVFSFDESYNVSIKEHSKPNLSYASLIAQAILSSPDKKMTLSDIYEWIADTYTYYKYAQNDWQNSIRHSLSLNKAFKKVSRKDDVPGKGSFWTIDSEYQSHFKGGTYKRNKKSIFSSLQHSIPESFVMTNDTSKSVKDSVPIAIMEDGQLALNPAYFNTVNDNNDSSKIQIVQAIALLQRYIITQLGPHAKNPQNAAAIAIALIVALDQQLQKQQSHKNFISSTFKNLISLLPNINDKSHVLSNGISTEDEQHKTESYIPLTFLTQIPQNTHFPKTASNTSNNQSYFVNDKLTSKDLYPVKVPPPPPYYSKSQLSVTSNLLSNSKKNEHIQNFSSEGGLMKSLSYKQGIKRPYDDNQETPSFTDVEKTILSNDNKSKKS